jgi:hypothetical protein
VLHPGQKGWVDDDRALSRSFLVRNRCGAHLVVRLSELRPYRNAGLQAKGLHAEDAARSRRGFPKSTGLAGQPTMTVPRYFRRRAAFGAKRSFGKFRHRLSAVRQNVKESLTVQAQSHSFKPACLVHGAAMQRL